MTSFIPQCESKEKKEAEEAAKKEVNLDNFCRLVSPHHVILQKEEKEDQEVHNRICIPCSTPVC